MNNLQLVCFSFYAVDIISAIEFDKTGDHLATGDRGGRVVLFERTDTKDVVLPILSVLIHQNFYFLEPFLVIVNNGFNILLLVAWWIQKRSGEDGLSNHQAS